MSEFEVFTPPPRKPRKKIYTQSEVERLCIEARLDEIGAVQAEIDRQKVETFINPNKRMTVEERFKELESLKETKLNKETK